MVGYSLTNLKPPSVINWSNQLKTLLWLLNESNGTLCLTSVSSRCFLCLKVNTHHTGEEWFNLYTLFSFSSDSKQSPRKTSCENIVCAWAKFSTTIMLISVFRSCQKWWNATHHLSLWICLCFVHVCETLTFLQLEKLHHFEHFICQKPSNLSLSILHGFYHCSSDMWKVCQTNPLLSQ